MTEQIKTGGRRDGHGNSPHALKFDAKPIVTMGFPQLTLGCPRTSGHVDTLPGRPGDILGTAPLETASKNPNKIGIECICFDMFILVCYPCDFMMAG